MPNASSPGHPRAIIGERGSARLTGVAIDRKLRLPIAKVSAAIIKKGNAAKMAWRRGRKKSCADRF